MLAAGATDPVMTRPVVSTTAICMPSIAETATKVPLAFCQEPSVGCRCHRAFVASRPHTVPSLPTDICVNGFGDEIDTHA